MTGTSDRRDFGGVVLAGTIFLFVAVGLYSGGLMLVGLAGGFAVGAVLLLVTRWRGPFRSTDAGPRPDPGAAWPRSDVINASSIRVAGVGGLGLVAMAVAIALDFPAIGAMMTLALAAGAAMAVVVIVYRHRYGPLPSSPSGSRPRSLF